ncbi:hypothetical protein GQ600_10779 [Phytophthora cactorum]|nr:hypothetical protein GQ600_10779 [Phytophthora cactorum]
MHSTKSIVERNKKSRMARTLHRRSSQISGRCTLRRSFCTHGVNHRYRGKGKRHDKKCDHGMHGADQCMHPSGERLACQVCRVRDEDCPDTQPQCGSSIDKHYLYCGELRQQPEPARRPDLSSEPEEP